MNDKTHELKEQKKPRKNIRSLFSNNKFVLIFSLIVAFGIWLWVSVEKSPVVEDVITGVPVQIDLENSIPSQLGLQVFGNSTYTVDVTVTGKKFIVSSLSADDIKVVAQTNYVDSSGNKSLSLKATINNTKDFEIKALSQNFITLYFDTFKEAEFALKANLISNTDTSVTDGCILGNVVFSKSTVSVSGPTTEINKITGINATYTINDILSATTTVTPKIELVGADSADLINVSVDTGDTAITMTIPVLKEVTLPTTVTLKNAPANYITGSLTKSVYPSTIKVGIPVEKLDQITEISVGTIDFNDIDAGNNVFVFKKEDISDYYVTDTNKTYKASVYVPDVISTVVSIPASNIVITNPKSGFNSTINTQEIKNVKIIGPASVINNITANDVYAEIDLKNVDISDGTVMVPVKVTVHDNTSCWANGSYSASITSVSSLT